MPARARHPWLNVVAVVLGLVLGCARIGAAADFVLHRLFLADGTTLVSYGEFARVADRVVFSIPVGDAAQASDLQLVSIPEASVDWERTDRYANAVRAKRFGETRGEDDFAILGGRVTEALNQIALTDDPARRLAMALEARGNLAKWPSENFGFKAAEVAQLVGMLDEAIAELRVAAGQSSFELSLVGTTSLEPPVEILPDPDFRETVEQAFAASTLTPEPAERVSLLGAIARTLQEPALRGGWAAALRTRALRDLESETRIDHAYTDLRSSTIAAATARAARGDIAGLHGLVAGVLHADDRLGRLRPRETSALLAYLDLCLDDARRLRLAREAWTLRLEAFRRYRTVIDASVTDLRHAKRALEQIRERAGPPAQQLPRLEQRLVMARRRFTAIVPPAELDVAHGLFSAAFLMARRAASIRQNAVSSKNMKLAWDASSAAAGSLMLLDSAVQELDRLTGSSPHR